MAEVSSQSGNIQTHRAARRPRTKDHPIWIQRTTRSSAACQRCRVRKVRCYVIDHGQPCTNCRYDQLECISQKKEKSQKSRKCRNARTRPDLSSSLYVPGLCGDDLRWNDQTSYEGWGIEHNDQSALFGVFTSTTSGSTIGCSPKFNDPVCQLEQPTLVVVEGMPSFIKRMSPHIGPDDIAYLKEKGALDIPPQSLRNGLIKAYIEFVYPYLPSLDLYAFIMAIENRNGSLGRVSLILFQAVMYAGSAFVDISYLESVGYLTRKEAQQKLSHKVQLLYGVGCETDRISLIQALLILTFHYETLHGHKDTWHWTGVVVNEAYALGLQNLAEQPSKTTEEIKLRKRIWWSVYMRDRMIALGMRRPMHIREDHELPMLTLDDFNITPITPDFICIPADCAVARDPDIQKLLAKMCIAKAKLCVSIGHILSQHYCAANRDRGEANDKATLALHPREPKGVVYVEVCDLELEQWLEDLPDDILLPESISEDKSIDLHRSLLHMIFFTAVSTLHRPMASLLSPISISFAAITALERSCGKVRHAASAITTIAQALERADLVKNLPLTGITVLLPALTTHLLDMKAPEESVRHSASHGFAQCLQVLARLKDTYIAADYTSALIEHAIRATGNDVSCSYMNHGPDTQEVNSLSAYNEVEPLATVHVSADVESGEQLVQQTPPPKDDLGLDHGVGSLNFLDYELMFLDYASPGLQAAL